MATTVTTLSKTVKFYILLFIAAIQFLMVGVVAYVGFFRTPSMEEITTRNKIEKIVSKEIDDKTKKPMAKQSMAKKPMAKQSMAKKPMSKKPMAKKPMAKKPMAKKPKIKRLKSKPRFKKKLKRSRGKLKRNYRKRYNKRLKRRYKQRSRRKGLTRWKRNRKYIEYDFDDPNTWFKGKI